MTAREIGTLKTELTAKPRIQNSQNCGLIPELTRVMMKVIMNDITTDVNMANKSSRYLADTFKLTSLTTSTFTGEKAFVRVIHLKKL